MSSSSSTGRAAPATRWLRLDGTVNARDLGGMPLRRGGTTARGRLLRSDNLQDLSTADVRRLREDIGLRHVIDLRTAAERCLEGPTRLDDDPVVTVHHLSLLPAIDDTVREADGDVLLPWQQAPDEVPVERTETRSTYLTYLDDRPDSIVAALRTVAHADGAVLLHCAAGKDRTGVVCALALDLAGVDRAAIVEDYLLTGERIDAILARLAASPTYAGNLRGRPRDSHLPRADAITDIFSAVDAHGGTASWLATYGWSRNDSRALAGRLTA